MSNPATHPRRLVLIGIGHTHAEIVRRWAADPLPGTELVCLSTHAESTYSGMLPGVLGGQLAPETMRIDLRELVGRAGGQLVLGEAVGLDRDGGRVLMADREPIPFDALSVGIGSEPAGWREHQDAESFVPIKPMPTFLERLHTRLDAVPAQHPSLAVIGGGAAGVEIAFCLNRLLRRSARPHRITLHTASERLADDLSEGSRRRIETLLRGRGVTVALGSRVTRVGPNGLTTETGGTHPADVVVWATQASAPRLLGQLGLATDGRGFLTTKPTLQSLSDPRVFAVGDSGSLAEHPTPKAGVYAVRQAPVLWHNLRAVLRDGPLVAYRPQGDFLKLLNTGDGKALLEYRGLTAHARWCWWLKMGIDRWFVRRYQG